eukprot:m.308646 g.308646  ORF g.308646 m.308646 type:complete len:482 (+) comp44430_c0_seq1:158-1603(+)
MVDERSVQKQRPRRHHPTREVAATSPLRRKPVDAEAVFEAVALGASRRLKKYLSGGGEGVDPNVRDDALRTLLMRACYLDEDDKREAIVRVAVESGCDVNAQDELGRTALTYAALFGRSDVVRCLLESGANALLEDLDGSGPLYHCASVGNAGITCTLIKAFAGRGLNINKRNLQGMTPLLQAAKLGHVECARVLVTEGRASSSIRDLDGFMNAVEWARISGRFTGEDLLALSPIVAKKMMCKERRRSLGRKILSDYFGTSSHAETRSGLIRQSGNTFHFFSQSDPETVSSDDEAGDRASALAVSVASTSAPNLPLLGSAWTSPTASTSQPPPPKSMFQLPKVKPQVDVSGLEQEAGKRVHKMHAIQEEDISVRKNHRFRSSSLSSSSSQDTFADGYVSPAAAKVRLPSVRSGPGSPKTIAAPAAVATGFSTASSSSPKAAHSKTQLLHKRNAGCLYSRSTGQYNGYGGSGSPIRSKPRQL